MIKPLIAAVLSLSLAAAPAVAAPSCRDFNRALQSGDQDAITNYAESVYAQLDLARVASGRQPQSTGRPIGGWRPSLEFWSQMCNAMGPDSSFRDAVVALYNMNSKFGGR